MSTRCVVTVIDENDRFSIYRHSDGYPDTEHGVIEGLKEAFRYAWPFPRFEASDFAAAIVRAWKDGGGGIYFSTGPNPHWDLAYHYEVRLAPGGRGILVEVFTPLHTDGRPDITGWRPHLRDTLLAPVKETMR